jgi:hypothetical protein
LQKLIEHGKMRENFFSNLVSRIMGKTPCQQANGAAVIAVLWRRVE